MVLANWVPQRDSNLPEGYEPRTQVQVEEQLRYKDLRTLKVAEVQDILVCNRLPEQEGQVLL